jgi:hypothetical protein
MPPIPDTMQPAEAIGRRSKKTARAGRARSDHATAPMPDAAAARLVRHITAGWRCQALHAAVQLGVAEALALQPRAAADLATALGLQADALGRLLRGLCTLGVCRERVDGCFILTRVGHRLCAAPATGQASLRDLVRWWGGPLWPMWAELAYSVRTGASAREKLTGDAGYAHLDRHGEVSAIFHGAQQAMTDLVLDELARWPGWLAVRHLVDVGGGHGQVALAVAGAHPDLNATIIDLPHAQAGACAQLDAAGLGARCRFRAGSFFDALPGGADVYLLKSILHNWDDAHCAAILARCAAAASTGAHLLIVERVRPPRLRAGARDEGVARTDLNMLAGLGGRERTAAQYAALLRDAGFAITGQWAMGFEFSVLQAERV